MTFYTRRDLMQGIGVALGTPLSLTRAQSEVTPRILRFQPEMEPLVALIEAAPRQKCAEMVVGQLRRGVSYRQLMGALFLAGVRNVNPRPPGFALHCVFIIHSAHLISMEAPDDVRLLPLFHALDHFKASQERDAKQEGGDYTMRAHTGRVPEGGRALSEFTAAMEAWDSERAELAVSGLARSIGPADVFEMMWQYGARDYRNIGHKAIFVANASRTLGAMGWQYAEPVLRAMVLGLLDFGREKQVNGYGFEDQCYTGNRKRMNETFGRLPATWSAEPGGEATPRMVQTMRTATPEEACAEATNLLLKGQASAGAIWDAVHLSAAELMIRARGAAGIAGIHAVTSANALHHAWLASSKQSTRFLILLQAVGWMVQFLKFSQSREENLRKVWLTEMEPSSEPVPAVEIFNSLGTDAAAAGLMRLARDAEARQKFLAAALRYTAAKSDEVHHYKFLAALIEDLGLVSPPWQPYVIAAMPYYLKGPKDKETEGIGRAREALRTL
ncbi:MAG: hypothetical protein JJE04_22760 [Acidobacteriia bacterium]|nr:hypothetical protein [Terriglobia bacterium]